MLRVILIFCLVCASCARKEIPSTPQTIRLSLSSEPPSLDPRTARDLSGAAILPMLFEDLPTLAEKVDISEDGMKYTFHLRKTEWSDGTPLTASDFVASWKTILDPRFPSDVAYHLFSIKNGRLAKMGEVSLDKVGVYAPDAYSLIVELEQPTPYFLELLKMSSFLPVSEKVALKNPNWAREAGSFVCNGPFQMKSWDHTNQITLMKNPKYFEAGKVRLDQIDLVIASADTALRMFEEGNLDWVGSPLGTLPIDAVENLKRENRFRVDPFLGTAFLRLNTEKKPLSSAAMRKALALSLDRSSIAEHILQGGQKAALSLVPPEMGLVREGYFAEGQLFEARKFLEQAREEGGGTLEPIVISYASDERRAAIAAALQNQWREALQIAVEIEAVEPKVYFQRLSKGELQIALGSWTADFNDPINFLEVFKYKENGTNNTGWQNLRYIDLLNRSALCRDLEERKQLLREAESLLMEEMPLIPLYHFALNYLRRDNLEGVVLSPLGHLDLQRAHWELEQPSLHTR